MQPIITRMRYINHQSIFDFKSDLKLQSLFIILLFSSMFLISGCSENSNQASIKPVPLGDKQALEQIAIAYRAATDKLMTSPNGLRPKGKRLFIENVFLQAGYNYNSTLLKMVDSGFNSKTQLHKDLAELVLLPQTGVHITELDSFNTELEIEAIIYLQNKLN